MNAAGYNRIFKSDMDQITLDRTDFDNIRLVQKNARLSNKQVAAAVRLAPSSCHERIKHLQTSGVIRGTHANIDLRAVGLSLEALFFIESLPSPPHGEHEPRELLLRTSRMS
jgi:DNA-binding Lrp family transcriptional regulator